MLLFTLFILAASIPSPSSNTTLADSSLDNLVSRQQSLFHDFQSNPSKYSEYQQDQALQALKLDFQVYLKNNPSNPYAHILYAKFLRQIDSPDEAHKVFLHVLKNHPSFHVVHQQLANYYAETANYPLALHHLLKAIDLSPKEPLYHYQLGELLSTYKNSFIAASILSEDQLDNQLLQAFSQAAFLKPSEWTYQARYAEAFYDIYQPNWPHALLQWNKILPLAPNSEQKEWVFLNQARVLIHLNQYPAARSKLSKIFNPKYESARRDLLNSIQYLSK